MKKTVTFCVLLFCGLSLAFAGGGRDGAEFPGGRPITLIVPWAAGGGSDIGARILLPYLERELGTTINIINPAGAAGWVGWERLLTTPADGRTISLVNFPALHLGYLDPSLGRRRTYDDFEFLGNHVTDPNGIAISPNETRFHDLPSLIAFARNNPVTATTTGWSSQHAMLIAKINDAMGTNLVPVPHTGFADSFNAFLGGHVDILLGTVGEMLIPERNGDVRPLVFFSNHDVIPLMPHVPAWNAMGISPVRIHVYSQRGLAMRRGAPPEVVQILQNAIRAAVNSPTQIAQMAEMGLMVDYLSPEEHRRVAREHHDFVSSFAPMFGW